jgi:glycosyltransferase involved in cell wall biosynthesis
VKVFHCETSHWLYHTSQHHRRLQELKERRGVAMRPDKIVDPNRGIEVADCATILGNDFTQGTFRFAGRPLYHVPIATLRQYPWPERKDFTASRGRYLWFGSSGLVHKGLDLALEAFAGMPEFHLTVCGPLEGEFASAYRAELTQTANITATGWVDVNGPRFGEIMDSCVGLVYPTCSEGASGSTVTCMHAGLIPVVSRQCGIDIARSYGVVLGDVSIEAIRAAVRALADVPPERLREMARGAWEFARATHTREHFGATYRAAVEAIVAEHLAPRRARAAAAPA